MCVLPSGSDTSWATLLLYSMPGFHSCHDLELKHCGDSIRGDGGRHLRRSEPELGMVDPVGMRRSTEKDRKIGRNHVVVASPAREEVGMRRSFCETSKLQDERDKQLHETVKGCSKSVGCISLDCRLENQNHSRSESRHGCGRECPRFYSAWRSKQGVVQLSTSILFGGYLLIGSTIVWGMPLNQTFFANDGGSHRVSSSLRVRSPGIGCIGSSWTEE